MQTKTFSHNGATITVQTTTGATILDQRAAEVTLGVYDNSVPQRTRYHRIKFAEAYAHSTIEGTLGFDWPEVPFDRDAMAAACEAWLALPGEVIEQWVNELVLVNTTPNDPDLKPPEAVEKKDAKTRK